MPMNRIKKFSESLVWMGEDSFFVPQEKKKVPSVYVSSKSPFEKASASATLAVLSGEDCPSLSPGQTSPSCMNHQGLRFASCCCSIIKLQLLQDEASKIRK